MIKKYDLQAGFSAVELLITLFIAVLFLTMGYQLYGAVISNSGETRTKAQASNEGYTWLRYYEAAAKGLTCPASGVIVAGTITTGITVSVTCPNMAFPNLKLVTVKTIRGNPPQEISHAIYSTQ